LAPRVEFYGQEGHIPIGKKEQTFKGNVELWIYTGVGVWGRKKFLFPE